MNILYTSTAYPPSVGGAQSLHHMMAQSLIKKHSVRVVSHWDKNRTDWLLGTTIGAPSVASQYEIAGVSVHTLGLSTVDKFRLLPWIPLYYPFMSQALRPISHCLYKKLQLHAKSAELVHNMRIGREGLSYASLKVARSRNIPFVFTPVHHPRWIGWRYRAYLKLYREADAVIALTPTEKKILIDLGVADERIHVTGTGPVVSPTAFPEAFKEKYGLTAPFVLFLGQHYPYKGYRAVLEAAKLVWKKNAEVNFVFVGPAVKNSEDWFSQQNDPRIKRLGKVSLQEKTDALAACYLLCVPSLQESFGSVYTEAWQFEKPVIGGNIPAISDVISDGIDGYLVEQSPEKIAGYITMLLNDVALASAMGKSGKRKVDEQYSWGALSRHIEQIYRSLL